MKDVAVDTVTAPLPSAAAAVPTGATPGAPRTGSGAGSPIDPDPRRWLALGVVLIAAFMVLLDISIVNVAIPSIQSNLHASFGQVQLVLAGYQLAYAVVLITGGRLGDIHGRRRLFIIGMVGFTLASALCGLAPSPEILIGSRVLQGLMAALMYPQVLSVIQVSFPTHERGAAFGIFGAIIGLATITGPLAGGLIIRDDIAGGAWRWVFLVNVPIGIAAVAAARVLLHETRAPHATRLDLTGVGIVSAGLLLLVYPLVAGRDAGWPAWALVSLAVSPLVLAAFVLHERSLSRRDAFPLMRLSLLRNRAFAVGLVASMVFFSGVPAFFFSFGLLLQIGLHYSALHAGLTTMPFALGTAVGSAVSVRLAPRIGKRILVLGAGLIGIGMAGVIVAIHEAGTGLSSLDLLPALMISGFGLGSFVAPVVTVILAAVEGRDAGAASGLLTTVQQVGGAMGVAIIGVIFFGLVGARADQSARSVAPVLERQLATARLPGANVAEASGHFVDCFDRRAGQNDPTETPPGCQPRSGSAAVTAAFRSAGDEALARDFSSSLERALLYNVVVFGATGGLVLLLPRARPRPRGGAPAAAG